MTVQEMRVAKLIASTSSRHDKPSVPVRLKWINFQSANLNLLFRRIAQLDAHVMGSHVQKQQLLQLLRHQQPLLQPHHLSLMLFWF